jgi:hypothetical protein
MRPIIRSKDDLIAYAAGKRVGLSCASEAFRAIDGLARRGPRHPRLAAVAPLAAWTITSFATHTINVVIAARSDQPGKTGKNRSLRGQYSQANTLQRSVLKD